MDSTCSRSIVFPTFVCQSRILEIRKNVSSNGLEIAPLDSKFENFNLQIFLELENLDYILVTLNRYYFHCSTRENGTICFQVNYQPLAVVIQIWSTYGKTYPDIHSIYPLEPYHQMSHRGMWRSNMHSRCQITRFMWVLRKRFLASHERHRKWKVTSVNNKCTHKIP